MDMTVSPCHSNSLPDSASNTTEGAEKPEQQIERGNIHDDVTITKPRLSLILTLIKLTADSDFGKNTQTRRLLVARCLIIFFFICTQTGSFFQVLCIVRRLR